MQLFSDFADQKQDQGTWFPFAGDVRFRIRALSARRIQQIDREVFGRVQELRGRDGERILEIDGQKIDLARLQKAREALIDSEHAEIMVGDEGAAAEYRKILPEHAGSIAAGQLLLLDGRWSDALRDKVLTSHPGLAEWIVERSGSLTVQAAKKAIKDEEGKEPTS